jgi:hypothetical protein
MVPFIVENVVLSYLPWWPNGISDYNMAETLLAVFDAAYDGAFRFFLRLLFIIFNLIIKS